MGDLRRQLLEQLRAAGADQRSLRVTGAGSKPWMVMQRGDRLSLSGHSGILVYDPAELVVTVRAGTPLAELEAALAERGQMLAMEAPDFNGASTIGGAVALGWSGSRACFAGGVRDAVLGLRMLNGLAEDLRFGGQVMKNVAGFDVSRLMVGSCGRLGPILELSLKVVPLPQQEMTLSWQLPDLASSRELVDRWTRLGYPVSAASYSDARLRVRFSGPGALLDELRPRLGGEAEDNAWWLALRRLEHPLFHHGWGDEKLFDCNGDVCWTAHSRRRGGADPVGLASGPDPDSAPNRPLLSRVEQAFDPLVVFQPRRAA
jgi:glycolate oxidase FAD binding subunit